MLAADRVAAGLHIQLAGAVAQCFAESAEADGHAGLQLARIALVADGEGKDAEVDQVLGVDPGDAARDDQAQAECAWCERGLFAAGALAVVPAAMRCRMGRRWWLRR